MASKKQIVKFLHQLAETMEIPPDRLAAAALEYANGVFGGTDGSGEADGTEGEIPGTEDDEFDINWLGDGAEGEVPDTEDTTQGPDFTAAPSAEPYTGPIHLCLDFGTAMSKAFAWDRDSDKPMPLRIGRAAGEPVSPYALNSTIFISREGHVFFGQTAVNHAAAADPERHQALQSIKDILTVGSMTDLREPVSRPFNPDEHPISRKDVVALYLAFLTDSALLALREDHQEDSRNVPRSYTKPVFDQERDEWATNILNECAAVGQALTDRFSGQWANGIPLDDLRKVVDATEAGRFTQEKHLVVESEVLPEPVAAFAGRVRNIVPEQSRRRLMMVIDAGAGTTDFAMFARVESEDGMRLFRIKNSVTTIRVAGDSVDNALMDYLLQQANVGEGHSRRGAVIADLRRDIRLIKEELFGNGSVTRQLVNDMKTEAQLDEFEECPAMVQLRKAMKAKFDEVLSGIDRSWLSFSELEVFFTGGGASLGMVTGLADQSVEIGESAITPIRARKTPPWLEKECEDIVDSYAQLAVCIGGACHGAGMLALDVGREFETFGGGLPEVHWKPDGFRDGQ